MSLINWLKQQPLYPKFYFAPRGAEYSHAGAGIKHEDTKPFEGAFGIVSFDGKIRRFVKPALSLRGPRSSLRGASAPKQSTNHGLLRNDNYIGCVNKAIASINQNQFQKVVLAHKQVITANNSINPFDLLTKLESYIPYAYHYLYQPEPELTFLGASPEQLFKRAKNRIFTEAQAGTKPRGTPLSDLLDSPKERHEHQLVIDNLLCSLKTLCIDYGITHERELVLLPQVQHLRTRLSGILRHTTSDEEILNTLQPTAAVCGWPQREAFEFIQNNEPFERGFYAGTIGYVSEFETEFAVAIRCALVKDCLLEIFGGAGIVKGSVPEEEWIEIQNKIAFWSQL